jgi:hypothetical protein
MPLGDETRGNISKLMVRRHLRTWLNQGYDEEALADLFTRLARERQDTPLRIIARDIDQALRANPRLQFVEVIHPADVPIVEEE